MTTSNRMTIMGHLDELRWRILKAAIAVTIGAVVAFFFREQLIDILARQFERGVPNAPPLTAFQVTEKFGLAMRVSLFGGVLLASPVLIYQFWSFVNPALSRRERRWVVPISAALAVLFAAGVLFAYWILPRGLAFLNGIVEGVDTLIGVNDFMSFTMRFLLVFGLAFEFPVFLFAAAAMGLVTSEQLARGRRWAVLVIVIIGAMVTPTGDPLTLMLLAGPLYLFYEITYWMVRLVLKR